MSAEVSAGPAELPGWLQPLGRLLGWVNRAMVLLGMLALLAASGILTSSVVTRYFLHTSTDWQDEASVFCLVGATFLCGGFVQQLRGHVGIEAISGLLPAWAQALRLALVDLMCLLFCSFFAWKSWTLWHEAWTEGQTTSSSWGPPLWIPYGLMAVGTTLLSLQLLVQALASLDALLRREAR
ncbi:MAG: TRAP transporter small permease [Paucibacter sp.]|nr:TRAP transporter small permease [Roseateles sp.]